MDEKDNKKLNNEDFVLKDADTFDQIWASTREMVNTYVEPNETQEERLKQEAEKQKELEMQAIREDIEKRYTLEIEETHQKVESVESFSEKRVASSSSVSVIDVNLDAVRADSQKSKGRRKRSKEKPEKEIEYIDLSEKGNTYGFVYNLGETVLLLSDKLFYSFLHIVSFPFVKLKNAFKKVVYYAKSKSKQYFEVITKELSFLIREQKLVFIRIFKSLKHPLKIPSIILYYAKRSFKRHREFLTSLINIAAPIIALIFLLFSLKYWNSQTFALNVVYNDSSIGYISDESVFIEAKEMVQEQMLANAITTEESKKASLDLNAGYKLALVSLDELDDARTISSKIIENSVENLTNACGIYIDDKFVCAVKNEADAKTVFYNILEPYENLAKQGNYVVGFLESIEYVQGLYRDDPYIMWDASMLESVLIGAKGNAPLVRVKKTITTSEIAPVPFTTAFTHDVTKYSGYRVTKQKGVQGTKRVFTTKVYVDGEFYDTYSTDEILIEPIEEILIVGTKTTYGGIYIGAASSKGFLWPAPSCHYVSSPYGWRSTGWHWGIDLVTGSGGARGTPVIASRSGRVEVIQRSNYGYGHMILINHGDGYKTRYAHLLAGSINVRMGEYVEAGKTIGKVGSTGNSSGPHLHFEVILNGENQDPKYYVS